MYTGEIAGLGDLPDGDEGAFVEVHGLYLRVHMRMETGDCEECSDESLSIWSFRFLNPSDKNHCESIGSNLALA